MVYPTAGVANSTGTAWGTSYGVGTAANDLVQLNVAAQLPAVSGALLTGIPWSGLSGVTSTNIIGLWTGTCSSSTYLNGVGACATPAGTGTVTDGAGTTTANELLASTTTAHTYNVVATLPTAAIPALTGDLSGSAGNASFNVIGLHFGATGFALGTAPSSGQCLEYNGTNITGAACSGTGFANPMTTLGDLIYGGASGTATRLAGCAYFAGIPCYATETPTTGPTAAAPVWGPGSVTPDTQTCSVGNAYTVAGTDRLGVLYINDASNCTVNIPIATTAPFNDNFALKIVDIGAGNAIITPATSTISYTLNGVYTSGATTATLHTGQVAYIYSDNTNYFADILNSSSVTVGGVTCTLGSTCFASNTTFTNATTAIGANSCSAAAATVTMTGVTTSSTFSITPSTDVSASTGWGSSGGLVIDAWPTANTLNYKVCNQTAASITPAAVTWNVSAR